MNVALIMAGGSGERFWPLSRKNKPKQLLKLIHEKTMIRETFERILPLIPKENIFISTNKDYYEEIIKEIPELQNSHIIIEPLKKDTAACIAYSTMIIKRVYEKCQLLILPSDHLIEDENKFREILEVASDISYKEQSIITLGIKPTKVETAYGYIEVDKKEEKKEFYSALRFWEKPNYERAEAYVEAGNYYWNSGMFICDIDLLIEKYRKYLPKHFNIIEKIEKNLKTFTGGILEQSEFVRSDFEKFEKISIDFGIMEKSNNIKLIPVDFGWNDVGSYTALDDLFVHNKNNSVVKEGQVIELSSKNNIIIGKNNKLIATLGVEDLIVVEVEDVLLICKKDYAQQIKKLLKEIDEKYK